MREFSIRQISKREKRTQDRVFRGRGRSKVRGIVRPAEKGGREH